ncbi:MAG TPA: hypothetical protein VD710_00255 [Nitrososphaeraceae archaeon]|nr:hypothetical protein [Nitrososphaeraceae archaeon]
MRFAALSKIAITMSLATLIIFSYSLVPIQAHIFTSNENVSFISLVDQLKSPLVAISRNNSSNIDAIKEQTEYAKALLNDSMVKEIREKNQRLATELPLALDSLQNMSEEELNSNITNLLDLLSETIDAGVEKDQLENTTIQALALARNVDKIFSEYSSAYDKRVIGMDMNMSMNMNMTPDNESSTKVPKDIQAYDRALAFGDITIDRFNTELKGKSENISSAQGALSGLEQLRNAMHNKEPPNNLLGIIHGQIHPNLQIAYGLELAKTMLVQSNTNRSE